jgi:ribosomal protein S18 acetylase RimI-like enzyme
MAVEILRTDSKSLAFIELTKMLDEDLAERYGDLQQQYDKHNKVENTNTVIIIYKDSSPVACGTFKEHDKSTAEMKRIFVKKEHRNQGLAKLIMNKLEELVKSQGYQCAVLETGIKQYEAIGFYKSIGYQVMQNYDPYIGNANSICMEKSLI